MACGDNEAVFKPYGNLIGYQSKHLLEDHNSFFISAQTLNNILKQSSTDI